LVFFVSRASGGAVWSNRPRTDLARAPAEKLAGATQQRQYAPIFLSFFAFVSWFESFDLLQTAFYPSASPQGRFSFQIAIFTESTAHHFLSLKF
jgi:uncharacterized membrane protein YadS